MKSALLRLREARDSLSATERSIADYLLAHPEEAMELSIHEMAERTFSSPSTMIRMCHRIGFDGYKEFRRAVTYEMAVRKQSEEEERKEIARSDSIEDIIEKITYKNIMSLEDTKNLLDADTLRQCVDLIRTCRTVLLFGMGASLCAARDAYLKFLRLNKPCIVNDDWHSQFLQARNATKDDLGIVISYSGETVEMVECMKAMRENHTPIIAITRCVSSPVSDLADYKLYTTANESTFRSGAMSSRIAQLNLIDILYTAFANSEYEYCLEQLSRTHIRKPSSMRKPMLDGGEDPLYIARRLIRFASEDVGMADSNALPLAVSVYQACHFLGMPECDVHLAHAAVYLSMAPKSNALYTVCLDCKKDIRAPVPLQIRNAPTQLMQDLHYGEGYIYAHDTKEKLSRMKCLPEELAGRRYYQPTEEGAEAAVKRRLEEILCWKEETPDGADQDGGKE